MHKLSKKAFARLLLLFTVIVWGATFVLVKSALADVTPLLFNLLRMALATLALAVINFRDLRRIGKHHLRAGAIIGLFLAAGYEFQTLGLARTSSTNSAFITGLVVVFVPVLASFPILRSSETPAPSAVTGLSAIFAFLGLVLLTTPAGISANHLLASIGAGDILTLVCALAFAAHLLTVARFAKGVPAGLLATLQVGACTLFMLAALPAEHSHINLSARLTLSLIVCSLLATAAAFTIQSFAQQSLPPTHTVLLLALEPVFAALTGLLFYHQSLSSRSLLGAALIMFAIVVVELTSNQKTAEIPT